jgi:gas vesicle protein
MNELLQNLLYAVITAGLPIILTYGISYLKTKRAEKLQNIENTYVKETITQATDIIMNVVDTIAQTYVDDLKKDGTFTPDNQKEALNKAVEQAKELLNDDVTELVVEKYNDLDGWIRATIESYIKSTKAVK